MKKTILILLIVSLLAGIAVFYLRQQPAMAAKRIESALLTGADACEDINFPAVRESLLNQFHTTFTEIVKEAAGQNPLALIGLPVIKQKIEELDTPADLAAFMKMLEQPPEEFFDKGKVKIRDSGEYVISHVNHLETRLILTRSGVQWQLTDVRVVFE